MGKTKTQAEVLETMFDATGEEERLNPDEIANLRAESEGEASPPPAKEEVKTEEAKVAATEAKPADEIVATDDKIEAADEVVVDEGKPAKKLSPAQERIRELNTAKKAAEEEAAELREKWARLEERQKIAKEQQTQREADEAAHAAAERKRLERPDPNIDPVGADMWDQKEEVKRLRQELTEAKEQVGQRLVAGQNAIEIQALGQAIQQDLAHVKSVHPDYDEVAEKLKDIRIAQWEASGVPRAKAEENVYAEVMEITRNAFQNGKSPSSIIYDIATQMGIKSEAKAKPAVVVEPIKPAPVITPKEKLAQIEAGQHVQGFGKGSNPATTEELDIDTLTTEQIAVMPEDTFLSILTSPQGKRLERRMQALELA